MKLTCPYLNSPIVFKEGLVEVLTVENPVAFRNIVQSIRFCDKEYVLSDDKGLLDLSKSVEFIENVFSPDFSSKTLISKIASEASQIAMDDYESLCGIMTSLNEYGEKISSKLDFASTFSPCEDVDRLMKFFAFSVDFDALDITEAILEYMRLCRKYFKKSLFVFVNLKCFLSENERELFYKNLAYEKFNVLLLEAFQLEKNVAFENNTIIDRDLCVIV